VIVAIVPLELIRGWTDLPEEFDFLGRVVLYRNSVVRIGWLRSARACGRPRTPGPTYWRTGSSGIGDDGAIEMAGDLRRRGRSILPPGGRPSPHSRRLRVDPVDVGIVIVGIVMIDADLEVAVQVFHPGAVDVAHSRRMMRSKPRGGICPIVIFRTSGIWKRIRSGVVIDDADPFPQPLDQAGQASCAEGVTVGLRWLVMPIRRLDRIFSADQADRITSRHLEALNQPSIRLSSSGLGPVENKPRIIPQLDTRGNSLPEVAFAVFQAFPERLLIAPPKSSDRRAPSGDRGHLHPGDVIKPFSPGTPEETR